LPSRRSVETALTYLPGVGRARAKTILDQARIDPDLMTEELTVGQMDVLRRLLDGAGDGAADAEGVATGPGSMPWLAGAAIEFAPYLDRVRAMVQRYLVVLRPWDKGPEADGRGAGPSGTVQTLDATCLRCLRGEALEPERLSYVTRLESQLARGYDAIVPETDGARRFDELRASFALNDLTCDAFWLLSAPELVPEFLWLYRALWRDLGRLSWSEDFVAHALDPFGAKGADVRAALAFDAPLLRYGLIEAAFDEHLSSLRLRAARFAGGFLLGLPLELSDLPGVVWHQPQATGDEAREAPIGNEVKDALARGFRARRRFVLVGAERTGVLRVAREALKMLGEGMLEVRLDQFLSGGAGFGQRDGFDRLGHLIGRARLARAGLFLERTETIDAGDDGPQRLARLVRMLRDESVPMFFHASSSQTGQGAGRMSPRVHLTLLRELGAQEIVLSHPDIDERATLWRTRLAPHMLAADLDVASRTASVYRFGPDEIELAVDLAAARARLRDPRKPVIGHGDLEGACRSVAASRLAGLASRVRVKGTWETVVLPEDTRTVLEEMTRFGKHVRHVMDALGYGRNMSYGRGITALFSGPSGTGKTLCAGLLARDLGLELFKVDLAQIVSKYIGETEERLAKLFDEAQDAGVALLFDEADSLFSKRTDVQSSTDRYANLEVNFLLQRLEDYDGVLILTTNFPDSIDTAFLRRIKFKARFPAPDIEERVRLWSVMIPADAPRDNKLDLREVAEVYELTGGQIQNAMLRAAVWAVDEGMPLGQSHLMRAAEREYRDMGRIVREVEEGAELPWTSVPTTVKPQKHRKA